MRFLKNLMLPSALLLSVVSASPTFAATIAQIEAQASGTSAVLDSNPVITAIGSAPGSGDGYTYTNYAILVQDATGSLDVFGRLPASTTYAPSVGDVIRVAGTYSPFDAIPEIATLTSIEKVSSSSVVPSPIPVTTAQLAGITPTSFDVLGHYLLLQNVKFSGASGNFPIHSNGTYTVTDLSGQNPLTLFQWASSYSTAGALGGTPIPIGPVNIAGIVDLFQGTPEFIPFSVTPVPEPASIGLLLGGLALLVWLARPAAAR